MVRSAHQEITAIEEIVYGSQFPRGRDITPHGRSHGEVPGSVTKQRKRGRL